MIYLQEFQSTPPCGGDRGFGQFMAVVVNFNPRPLAGATRLEFKGYPDPSRFQSTPPCGGDHRNSFETIRGPDFNPRPLAGATLKL